MKYGDLLALVGKTPVFTTSALLAGQAAPEDVRRQLNRWVHAGKIIKLRRGVYALPLPYAAVSPHPFAVAMAMKKASYVSLHSALAHHGLIPEQVPVTTCVTTRRPEQLETPMGTFSYRHLTTSRFFGFTEYEVSSGQYALLASPEKAILDLLYLVPESDAEGYLRELRLEPTSRLDVYRLEEMTDRFRSRKVERAVRTLRAIWEEQQGYTAL